MAQEDVPSKGGFLTQIHRVYWRYTLGFLGFVAALAVAEQMGLPREWIGFLFLVFTVAVYGGIGIMCRTTDPVEFYVAGRRIPALYNGLATGADWMSAASFIGLAGTLYLSGYAGLAFVLGWTGGFCLVALLLAPYLRKFGQFTVPDFLGDRYGGNWPRLMGVAATVLVSFIYVVAQIYGVGLITSRLLGVAFELGIFLGLGGVLVCSFLGGMRAVTWTQVAQYIVIIVAYLMPVVWLSVKQTGVPVPQVMYGYQLEKVGALELDLKLDTRELEVRQSFVDRGVELERKLSNPAAALVAERMELETRVQELRASNASQKEQVLAEKALARLPREPELAAVRWKAELAEVEIKSRPLNGMLPQAQQYAGDPAGEPDERLLFNQSRNNFLALVFCLMVGTAALPHVLTRSLTTPNVSQARHSVTWSLLFIALLYCTAPALAVLVKYEVFQNLVGTPFDALPAWVDAWHKVDPTLLTLQDINGDGVLQLNEMTIGGDIIVLATAEIAGLPYVVSGLVAAGGLAAALSTADGLLLTIASAFSHDVYYKTIDPEAGTARRVTLSKLVLLVVALAAAYVAVQKPADILFLVAAAFSIGASTLFPALTLGIFWKRATGWGAVLGMLGGLGVSGYYMVQNQPWLRDLFGVTSPVELWWGIQPISAGVFGVPVAFAVTVLVSLITPAPPESVQRMVEQLRYPKQWPR